MPLPPRWRSRMRDEDLEHELRRQRHGLALATALGDLSGELSLEGVTGLLSDFADRAIGRALEAAIAERVPGADPAGSRSSPWASSAAASSTIPPTSTCSCCSIPRPSRARRATMPGEAAVRIGRRVIELLQKRTAAGYVARVDLQASPVARSHADRPAGERGHLALRILGFAVGARSLHSGPGLRRRHRARRAIPECDRALRVAPLARFRGDRGSAADIGADPRPFRAKRADRTGLRPQARPRRHSRSRVLRPDPADDPRRTRSVRFASRRRSTRSRRCSRRGGSIDATRTTIWPTPTGCCGRSSTGCRWSRTRRPTFFRAIPMRSTMSRICMGWRRAPTCSNWSLRASSGPARSSTASSTTSAGACRTIRTSCAPNLSALGFADAEGAARHVAQWRSGKARSLRSPAAQHAFEAMLPALMRAIAAGADPERALNRLSDIVERLSSGVNLFRLLEARPPLADLLAKVLAHAPALADQLARRPELFEGLFDASSFEMPPEAAEFAELLGRAMQGQPYDVALDRVRRLVNERRFALGVQLIDRRRDPLEVTEGYARVAEGALVALAGAAADEFETAHGHFPDGELVILGLGRFGGHALTHASDLDLIYLHTAEQDGMSDGTEAARPQQLLQPARQSRHRGAQRPDGGRPAVRGRYPPAAGGRDGHAHRLARCVRGLSAQDRMDVGAYGAVPRAAGVRIGRGARARRRDHRRNPSPAARSGRRSWRTLRRCARRSSVTSRRTARST